jgi:uncharacterized protein (TIGR03118 family)
MKIACLPSLALLACMTAGAQVNTYTVTPIIDDTQDQFLINPWGMSRPVDPSLPEGEWWLSDNGTGFTTLYDVSKTGPASLLPLVITIPSANGTSVGTPTGTAYNKGTLPGPGRNNFAFVTLDGTISNFNMGEKPAPGGTACNKCHVSTATVKVNNSSLGAVYTGLTVARRQPGNLATYYAANFNGGVEAYDAGTFARVTLTGTFTDPRVPTGNKPFGIQTIGTRIFVTFFNGVSGGFVDAFDTSGRLRLRLANGSFSEPWGVVQAPANFGQFSNMLLVGNTHSGMIGAYDPTTGAFQGFLQDAATGGPITVPGLWGIAFGNGNSRAGPTNTLYYAYGGADEQHGVFGAITAN